MGTETALTKREETSIAVQDQWTANEVIQQVQLIQQIMKRAMKDGEHYGKIPGCGDKPSLLKAGAEKLGLTFRLAPQFKITKTDLPGGHREYEIVCSLIHIPSGQVWGEGVGSCSTMESKFRYRKAALKCPKCGQEAIIKGKKEFGGGWLCWQKKGGCGAKFKDNDPAIKNQKVGKVENENLADQYNTVLKVSKKRSHVDAMLTCTAASDIFTQDVEELKENGVVITPETDIEDVEYSKPQSKANSAKKQSTTKNQKEGAPGEQKISASQWTQLCKESMSCKNFKDGQPIGVARMFEAAKKVFGIKKGTDLTLKQVEIIENTWFHNWENGSFNLDNKNKAA